MSSITSDGKPGASPKIIRWIALGLLVAYIAIFIALSAMILSVFASMVAQGGGFVPGFETIQLKRLIAFLAPYLSLPVLFVVALIFYRKMKYRVSIIVSLIVLLTIFGTAQTYLHYNPDPIQQHFGALASPAPGFLILTAASLPHGFVEKQHHFSMHEYATKFTKTSENGTEFLSIVESDITKFLEPKNFQSVTEFTYRGQLGRVYSLEDQKDKNKMTHSLYWYSGPKQRIHLSISAPKLSEYSPGHLVRILESMQVAHQ